MPGKEIFTVYLRDDSTYEGSDTKLMGVGADGRKFNWSYEVRPGEKLFPYGRVIVCSNDMVFYDGPNIYWHGEFPLHKLYMDLSFVYEDSYLSKSVTSDLIQHQDLLNELTNGIIDNARRAIRPNVWADGQSIAKGTFEKFDPRKGGQKLWLDRVFGKGIEFEKPQLLPNYVTELRQLLGQEMEMISGTTDMRQLLQLKQVPSAESVETLYQALAPVTRLRGRLLESCIRSVAEQVKMNFFQFYEAPRRISILGSDGLSLQDFDFDPGSLIPNDQSPRDHAHNFTFYVTPNSLLEIALMGKKMLYLQLRRQGDMDWESLMEALEIPGIEQKRQRLGSELEQKMQMAQQIQGGQAGRPPSGQVTPHFETKGDGRQVVSES